MKREKPKSRKDLRKEKRNQKKVNRFSYHNSKKTKVNEKDSASKIIKNGKTKGKIQKSKQDIESEMSEEDEEIPSDFEEEPKNTVITPTVSKFDQKKMREKDEETEYYKGIKQNRIEQ